MAWTPYQRCENGVGFMETYCAETATQPEPGSSRSQLAALRRFGKNIAFFWQVIVYALVMLSLLSIWADRPHFYATPPGWAALSLAAFYLFAFTFGTRWISGTTGMPWRASERADAYWKERLNTGRVLYPWRAVMLWAVLLGLAIGMIGLNDNFVWLMWIPYGMSFSLLPMPRGLLMIVPTAALMMAYNHEFPASLSVPELLKFAGFAIGLACYSAVIFMPIMLLRNRFQRERMFLQLERSHHELEGAHQRLAQAAAHERELAVLRERGRLARDMHDTLGHSLALMTVKLEAAQRLRVVDPARADHEVAATQAIARGALAELRDAIADLRASDGSDGAESSDGSATTRESLGVALTRAAEASAARAGWRLTCEMAPDAEPICDLTYEALLRTGVEALTNSERHAQAHSVHIALSREGELLRLRIEDDGVGILATNPPQRVRVGAADDSATAEAITSPRGHYGITGMRERTTGAGGVLTIATGADGCGTRVEALLPAGGA